MTQDTADAGPPGHSRHGKLGYIEIPAIDVRQSAAFYERLFGWKVDVRDETTASFGDGTGELIGHWVTGHAITGEPGFVPYIYVDDIAATIAGARSAGTDVVEPPHDDGGLLVATIRDPAGNVIGIWHQQG